MGSSCYFGDYTSVPGVKIYLAADDIGEDLVAVDDDGCCGFVT